MAVYEIIKDCINVARKADNIPLVQSLIEVQTQLFDLINENYNLREENRKLKENRNNLDNIERHNGTYITLKNDDKKTIYCSCCFDKERKLIQVNIDKSNGCYWCHVCKNRGYFNDKQSNSY